MPFYHVEEAPFYPLLSESFYHVWGIEFYKVLFLKLLRWSFIWLFFFIYEHSKLHWLLLTIKVTTKIHFSWCIIIFICFEIWFSKKLLRIFPSMLWSQSICTFFFLIVYFNGFDFGAVLALKGVEMCSSFYFL